MYLSVHGFSCYLRWSLGCLAMITIPEALSEALVARGSRARRAILPSAIFVEIRVVGSVGGWCWGSVTPGSSPP